MDEASGPGHGPAQRAFYGAALNLDYVFGAERDLVPDCDGPNDGRLIRQRA